MDVGQTSNPEFAARAEAYRREIQVHCYRMLGSLQDAEDLAQDTLVRAWQKRDALREQTSLRAWLYKIATNACLDALARRPKRVLPNHYASAADPHTPPAPPVLEPIWLEPLPDALYADAAVNPEARYSQRESVSLAFLAALHTLPARQRAVLLLRDVLDWSAQETAHLLHLTVPAVNSALHRARVTLSKQYHRASPDTLALRADDPETRALLDRYVRAWETANIDELLALLQEDATFLMPPSPSWLDGAVAMIAFAKNFIAPEDAAGLWKLIETRANGEIAFAWYRRLNASKTYRAFGLQTLEMENGKMARWIVFTNPALWRFFELPQTISVD